MKFIKLLLLGAKIFLKKFEYKFIKTGRIKVIRQDIPYFSQFASEELVEDFISGKKSVYIDPNWKCSGARTKSEYARWAWNGCGMACLQMILFKKLNKKIPLVTLGDGCMSYGGYRTNIEAQTKGDLKNYFAGLFYEEFLHFIEKEFKLKGKIVSPLITEEIIDSLKERSFVIASVNPNIRDVENKSPSSSGHLVLIIGYDLNKKILYFHNPSGYFGKSQKNIKISFQDFECFFRNRGIVVL